MAKRSEKKHQDLKAALEFIEYVIDQLERHGKTKQVKSAMDECIKKMPKLDTQPSLKTRYTNMLNRIGDGNFTTNLATTYFQREKRLVRSRLADFS